MNASLINKCSIHLQISLHTIVLCLELDESILQAIPSLPVPHDFATCYLSKSREYKFKIMLKRNLVQLANKKHILRWFNFSIWQIIDDLQYLLSLLGLMLFRLLLDLFLSHVFHDVIDVDIIFKVSFVWVQRFDVIVKLAILVEIELLLDSDGTWRSAWDHFVD